MGRKNQEAVLKKDAEIANKAELVIEEIIEKDKKPWCAAVHGAPKSRT